MSNPNPKNDVLLITGVTQTTDWYLESLLSHRPKTPTRSNTRRIPFGCGHGAAAITQALTSGNYKSVIVCDLSHHHDKFVASLGRVLQAFVYVRGGRVAFPTTEAILLLPVLQQLFHVPWKAAAYGREMWSLSLSGKTLLSRYFPHMEQVDPNGALAYSAKACSFSSVPTTDSVYSLLEESDDDDFNDDDDDDEETESLSAVNDLLSTAAEALTSQGATVTPSRDTDASQEGPINLLPRLVEKSAVTIRAVGKNNGAIAVFGDVNCENTTASLVWTFAEAASLSPDQARIRNSTSSSPYAFCVPEEREVDRAQMARRQRHVYTNKMAVQKTLADAAYSGQEYTEAARLYRKALSAVVLAGRAENRRENGDEDILSWGQDKYQGDCKEVDVESVNIGAKGSMSKMAVEILCKLAECHMHQHQWNLAVDVANKAVKLDGADGVTGRLCRARALWARRTSNGEDVRLAKEDLKLVTDRLGEDDDGVRALTELMENVDL